MPTKAYNIVPNDYKAYLHLRRIVGIADPMNVLGKHLHKRKRLDSLDYYFQ